MTEDMHAATEPHMLIRRNKDCVGIIAAWCSDTGHVVSVGMVCTGNELAASRRWQTDGPGSPELILGLMRVSAGWVNTAARFNGSGREALIPDDEFIPVSGQGALIRELLTLASSVPELVEPLAERCPPIAAICKDATRLTGDRPATVQ